MPQRQIATSPPPAARAGGSPTAERWATGTVIAAMFVVALSIGSWSAPWSHQARHIAILVWTLAGVALGGVMVIPRVPGCVTAAWTWAQRAREKLSFREVRRLSGRFLFKPLGQILRSTIARPGLVLSGPITALMAFGQLSYRLGVPSLLASAFLGPVLVFFRQIRIGFRNLNELVALPEFGGLVAGWIGQGVLLAYELHWPGRVPGYFDTMAPVNATLLVAGVISAVPTAWQKTSRLRLTWVLVAPTIAAIALTASIVGMVTSGDPILFILSASAVLPVAIGLATAAYTQATREERRA